MRRPCLLLVLVPFAALLSLAGSCGQTAPLTAEEHGRKVYVGYCSMCHGPDPRQDTPLGPAIHGASLELLEARVLHNRYPEGYTPKRDTRLMLPIQQLAPDLPALFAYLRTE